jgi:hypothetical protein
MIKGDHDLDVVKHFYPVKPIYKKEAGEVIHLLHLYGSSHEKILYCFMELFSITSFLVILSTDYDGKNIKYTYAYDVVSAKTIEKDVKLKITQGQLEKMPTQFSDFAIVKSKADRVIGIGEKIQTDKYMKGRFEEAVHEIWAVKYGHKKRITRQMIDELTERIAEEMVSVLIPGEKEVEDFDRGMMSQDS